MRPLLVRFRTEVCKFARNAIPLLCIGRGRSLRGDIRPLRRILAIETEPVFQWLRVGLDRLGRALRFAHATIDALIWMNDEHILTGVKAVDRTDFDAVHILALDAVLGNDICHDMTLSRCKLVPPLTVAGRQERLRGNVADSPILDNIGMIERAKIILSTSWLGRHRAPAIIPVCLLR